MEPSVVSVSQPFIDRNALAQLARPRFETLREGAQAVWYVASAQRLPINAYTTAVVYMQKALVLNPTLLEKIEARVDAKSQGPDPSSQDRPASHGAESNGPASQQPAVTLAASSKYSFSRKEPTGPRDMYDRRDASTDIKILAAACVATAFLTEGHSKRIGDVARTLRLSSRGILAMQREVLETICFDFRNQSAPVWVVKLGKRLTTHPATSPPLSRDTIKLAWHVAIDVYETSAVLQFPAHQIAAACIEIAAMAKRNSQLNAQASNQAANQTPNAQTTTPHDSAANESASNDPRANHLKPNPHGPPADRFTWNLEGHKFSRYALDSTSRLLLEFYDRCSRLKLNTHAPLPEFEAPIFRQMLQTLQRNTPKLQPTAKAPTRAPGISPKGTVRMLLK